MATNDFVVKNGLDVTEAAIIRATTDSSTKDTGALIVEGGIGVEKNLSVGVNLTVSGTAVITGNTTITGDLAVNGADITTTATGTATIFNANATTLNIGQAATTVSIGQTTGTTTVRNALTVGGAFTANSGAVAISPANANVVLSPTGTGAVTMNPATLGTINNMSIGATTASTGRFTNTTITGSLTAGGVTGTTGQALVSTGTGIIWATPTRIDNDDTNVVASDPTVTITANGVLAATFTSTYAEIHPTTEASSSTTGSLRVGGGLGVVGRIYGGSLQNTPIGSSVASTAAFTSLTANGAVTFTQNTASTTTTSGTLVVSGGIGLTGAINSGLSSSFNGLTSTNTTILSPANASVTISPTGTGTVTIAPATAGTINNMSIGATTATTGRFTTLTTTSTATFSPANANVILSPTGTGTVTIAPATAGTINNMSIGATTATTGRFTTVTSTQATGTAPFTVASTTVVTNLNADLLDGFNSAQASTVSTVAVRDASGDIVVRLVRSEFANEATISGAMAFRVNNSTDNYIRFCSDTPAIRTFLNVPTRTGGDATGTWAISITGNAGTATSATTATTATNATNVAVTTSTAASAFKVPFANTTANTTGNYGLLQDSEATFTYNPSTNTLVAGTFSGALNGNASTVTNGVYTTGNQTIGGNKTFTGTTGLATTDVNTSSALSFGSQTRQMVNLWGTSYGLGVQSSTFYYRTGGRFSWFRGGIHSDTENTAGTGGTVAMTLDSASNLTVTGTITEQSSIRYKENINPIDNALEKVLQLQGVTYDRKDGTAKNEPGMIAEEVAKVIPNLVSHNDDGIVDGIHYSKTVAYLVECIKELNAKIERLEGKQ
jgi:hypothetical protein